MLKTSLDFTLLLANAMMTLLKLDRELLMFFVSSSLRPVEPDSFNLENEK